MQFEKHTVFLFCMFLLHHIFMLLSASLRGQFTKYYSSNKMNMNTFNRSRFGQAFSIVEVSKGKLWIIDYVHIVFQVFSLLF